MTKPTHEELLRSAVEKALTGKGLGNVQWMAVNAVMNAIRPIIALQTPKAVEDGDSKEIELIIAETLSTKVGVRELPRSKARIVIRELKAAGYRITKVSDV